MSIHRGHISLGPVCDTVEITTTLYELMEAMGKRISSLFDTRARTLGKKRPDPAQDRMVARKVAGMIGAGRIKFKHPRDIRSTYPEWCE